jgi:hypothetical protein
MALLFFGIEADKHDDLSALADLAKGKG